LDLPMPDPRVRQRPLVIEDRTRRWLPRVETHVAARQRRAREARQAKISAQWDEAAAVWRDFVERPDRR
jgi:hypothetical protein